MAQQTVPPDGVATYPVRVCGASGYTGPATLRLQFVREGVAHYNPIFSLRLDFRSSERELGGVNLSAWCQRAGFEGAALDGPIRGKNAAYRWYCYRGSERGQIDVTDACRRDYADGTAYARALDLDDAYSWRCYTSA